MSLSNSLPLDNTATVVQSRSSVTVSNQPSVAPTKRKMEQPVLPPPKKEPLSPEKVVEAEEQKPLSPVPIDLSLKGEKPSGDIYTTWKEHVKEFLYNDDNSSNSLLSILSGKDKENCGVNTSMEQPKKQKSVRFAQSPIGKPSEKKRKAELAQSPAPHLQATKRLGLAAGKHFKV